MFVKKHVKDIMTEEVRTVEENTTVLEAVKIMAECNIGAVVVMSPIKEAVGIFTERDLLKRVTASELNPQTTPISKVMSAEFVCAQADDELNDLPEIMTDKNIRHLPVVDGHDLIGILSMRDLIRYLNTEKSG